MIDVAKDRSSLYERIRPKWGEDFDGKGTGWIFHNQYKIVEDVETALHEEMRCGLFWNVFFPLFRMIPSRCRECYKVVVTPQTVFELFDLYEAQRSLFAHSKCGIANRELDSGMYSGYFYCRGLEVGEEVFSTVREMISPHIPVILKRYCTEFEIGPTGLGPSDLLAPQTKTEKDFEDYVLNHYIGPERSFEPQTKNTIRAVMLRWLFFARRHGDLTYKEFTNGVDLYDKVVTYHGE